MKKHHISLSFRLFLFGSLLTTSMISAKEPVIPEVTGVPQSLREAAHLSSFYQKVTHAGPLPVLGSAQVSDYALREAVWIVQHMLEHRPELLQVMADHRVRMVIMAYNEYTTDLPEQANLKPKAYWDRRARGLGGRIISGAEENLLAYPGDPYATENILIHEFGHVIQGIAMPAVDPNFNPRLRAAYHHAMAAGLWKNTYAGSNVEEYWAEAVQDWFDNNRENDSAHNQINTRSELQAYDPNLAGLCAEVLGHGDWRYQKPMARPVAQRAHLAGYDPNQAPRFHWREETPASRPRIKIETDLGDIEAELFEQQAPITVANFLHYVEAGYFTNGRFFRTVTLDNQPHDTVKIQVIQAQAHPEKASALFAPIALERTRDTGIRHLDGTLSMARNDPDSAQESFSICVGDQPELDFGGRRQPDGQGFAAFGRVTQGMDIVRKIQAQPCAGQQLTPAIRIKAIVRLP